MPFDMQGARAAGYSDAEIASFLGKQVGFDTDAAVKAGYKPDELVPFLAQRAATRDDSAAEQSTVADQPAQGDPMGSGAAEIANAPFNQPEAGAGRGFVNPPAVGQTSAGDVASRVARNAVGSVGAGVADMAQGAGMLTLAPAQAVDFVDSLVTGKTHTEAVDFAAKHFVDPNVSAAERWAPKPEEQPDIAEKVVNGLMRLAPSLAVAVGTSGASAEPAMATGLEAVRQAVLQGMRSMPVPAFSAGVTRAADLIRQGAPITEAIRSGLTEGATTDLTGGLAMSAPGANLLTRAAQGAAVGATTGDVARQAQNLAAPDYQTERTPEQLAVSALTGAVLGAGTPHATARAPARADDVQAAPRDDVAPEAVAHPEVGDVLKATSIDDAIAAADVAARSPGGDAVRDQMLAIRPLDSPTLEQELAALRRPEGATDDSATPDLPAVAAGDDRSGVPESAAGVGARAGGADEPANAVAAEPVAAGAPDLSVPPRDADAVTRGVADPAAREAQIAALPASEVEAKAAQITMRRNDSGTIAVLGDPGAVSALLRAHDVPFIPSREGALVGRTNADAAQRVVSDFAPSAPETADAGQGAASSVEPLPDLTPNERRALEGNPLRTFLMRQGVALKLARDFAPGTKERLAMGRTFRKNGLDLDALAQRAAEQGFLKDGSDVHEMYELVRRAVSGERIAPLYGQDGELDLRAAVERQRMLEHGDAQEAAARLSDESLSALEDEGIPWDNIKGNATEAEAMRALGFTDEEIFHATTQGPERAQSAGQGRGETGEAASANAGAGDRSGEGQAPARGAETGLSRPSADDVIAQQERRQQGERAEQQRRADEESRARADAELPDFKITGSERAADVNPDQGPLFKRGSDTASGITEATFHDQMARAFGDKVAQRLIDKGVVVPIPDQSKLPDHVVPFVKDGETIFGFYDPKTDRTYAVLSNLKPEMVKPLALHEVGVHYGFENMLGRDKYNQVIKRIAVMGRAGHQAVIEAKAQAKENSAHAGQVPEETLAYLVTNHPEMSLVREVIARIKAFLFDKFGIGGKYLTTDDITALARAAVLHSSRGEAGSRAPEFAPQFSRASSDASDLPDEVRKPIGAYHVYDNLERVPRESSGGIADSIAKALVPAGREGAIETGGIVRANLAEQARGREMAQQKLMDFAKRFDAMPVKDNYAFIDAMERGIPQKNAELDRAAVALRKALDERRDQVRALGKGALENFNQNYFPHIWKDKTSASNFFTRRPLEGGKGFLKQRTYDYFSDGLKAGLEPITTNPVELALLKAREMDRYIYGQRIFAEMKQAGVAKFVRFGDKAPEGWQKINDKIARVTQYSEAEKGMVLRGEYYAPEQAATLINNHLSPGLSGVAAFDMIRRSGNIMNATQLGLSAFHLGFTTLDAMISKAALGIKQATRGDIFKGTGNVLQSLNPAQPFLNLFKGDRLLKAYMGNINDPDLAPIVEALVQGGGRVKMDDVYRNAAVNEFRQAIRKGQYATAALKSIPRALDLINAPIFQWLVPRQKLGVFFDMAKDALEKNPEMSLQEKRQVMGKLWDSVDNRMGELVYDNVFWNRALKDALMVSVRSVGWNLGTFREIGGGIKDIKDIPKLGGLSDRTAYIFGLTFVTAMIGSLTQYMLTGEPPKDLKDVFFPRTGKIRPDGTEDRISLPSYMKDIYEYGHDIRNFAKYGDNPFNTLGNKLHPLISTLVQIFTNKDFFGGAIRSPGDSSGVGKLLSGKLPTTTADWQQELDEADYLVKQMTPFSYRNYMQQTQLKGEEPSISGYLSSPSMIGITPSPGYITKSDEQAESSQVNKMRESLVTKFREEMRDGAEWPQVRQRAMDAGLRGQDLTFIRKAAEQRPPKRLKEFANH